jgi:hypothetical protein
LKSDQQLKSCAGPGADRQTQVVVESITIEIAMATRGKANGLE